MAMNVYHCDRCDEVYAIVIPIAVGAMSEKRRLEVDQEIEQRRLAHLAARHAEDLESGGSKRG